MAVFIKINIIIFIQGNFILINSVMEIIFSHTDQQLEDTILCYFDRIRDKLSTIVVQGHLEYFTSFTSEVYSLLKLISETLVFITFTDDRMNALIN